MNHEIGTHFIRKYNDRGQKWFKERKKYNLENYLESEEGLAAINQQLPFVLKGTYSEIYPEHHLFCIEQPYSI